MDVYHKVLFRLYEVTGGKESESVDLKELVKKAGFLPSYPDIFQHLSRQSWISETARVGVVKITHWGVKEAKKSNSSEADSGKAIKKETNRTISEARELIACLEEFASDASKDGIVKVEKKLEVLGAAVRKLKESIE